MKKDLPRDIPRDQLYGVSIYPVLDEPKILLVSRAHGTEVGILLNLNQATDVLQGLRQIIREVADRAG